RTGTGVLSCALPIGAILTAAPVGRGGGGAGGAGGVAFFKRGEGQGPRAGGGERGGVVAARCVRVGLARAIGVLNSRSTPARGRAQAGDGDDSGGVGDAGLDAERGEVAGGLGAGSAAARGDGAGFGGGREVLEAAVWVGWGAGAFAGGVSAGEADQPGWDLSVG